MRIFAKQGDTPNYLFGLLPHYFKENDSYKVNGVGLLERYLNIFCEELDGEVSDYITKLGLLYDPLNYNQLPGSNSDDFLIHLAELYGNPPDLGTSTQYQKLLRYIFYIFKTKGTRESLELFLALLGYSISSLNESAIGSVTYDNEPTPYSYDDPTSLKYDSRFIFYSDYSLVITDYPGTTIKNPSTEWLESLRLAIIKFINPIWADLTALTYTA